MAVGLWESRKPFALHVMGNRYVYQELFPTTIYAGGRGAPPFEMGVCFWVGMRDHKGRSLRPAVFLLFTAAWEAVEDQKIFLEGCGVKCIWSLEKLERIFKNFEGAICKIYSKF